MRTLFISLYIMIILHLAVFLEQSLLLKILTYLPEIYTCILTCIFTYIHSTGIHKQFAGYFVLSEVSIRTVTSQQAMWATSETLHPIATLMLHQPEGLTCPRQSHLTCPTHSIMDYLHLSRRCTRIHLQLRGIKCQEVRSGRGRAMALFSKELWTMERCHLGHEDLVLLMENPRHLLPLPPQKSTLVIFSGPERSLKLTCRAHLK